MKRDRYTRLLESLRASLETASSEDLGRFVESIDDALAGLEQGERRQESRTEHLEELLREFERRLEVIERLVGKKPNATAERLRATLGRWIREIEVEVAKREDGTTPGTAEATH